MFSRKSGGLGRIGCGFLFGGLLLVGALATLWFNEGRTNMATVAEKSVPVTLESIATVEGGTFVALQGTLEGIEPLGDPPLLKPGPYIEIQREVEMYAWEESSASNEGEENSEKTYRQVWTESPANSNEFSNPVGHANPLMAYDSATIQVPSGRIGRLRVQVSELSQMPVEPLPLSEAILHPAITEAALKPRLEGGYLYIGPGSLNAPQIGDLRIAYLVFEANQAVTLFGQLTTDAIVPYVDQDGNRLYRAFTSGREEAISQMGLEYRFLLWGLRFGGFIMNWIGLMILVSPITSLLGRIPGLGRLGNGLIAVVALLVAALLSIVVIIVSVIAHNPLLLILFLLIGVGVGYWLWRQRIDPSQAVD